MYSSRNDAVFISQLEDLKLQAYQVTEYFKTKSETYSIGERIDNCAGVLRIYIDQNGEPLNDVLYCKHRQCPICQWRRQCRHIREVHLMLNANPRLLDCRWMGLTLTKRTGPVDDLRSQINYLSDSFRRLERRTFWKRNVIGGIRFLEVAYNPREPMYANPHYHCLLLVRPSMFSGKEYVSRQNWAEAWAQALKSSYLPSIETDYIKETGSDLRGRIASIVAYSTKPRSDIPDRNWLLRATTELKDVNMVRYLGDMRNYISNAATIESSEFSDHSTDCRRLVEPRRVKWDPNSKGYVRITG